MIKRIVSWFQGGEELKVEPFYRAKEVWTYRHVDPRTRRASTRAVLIFRKASDGMFWGLPLMKANVRGKMTYVPRRIGKASTLSQMRTLKAERLVRKIGTAGEKEFAALASSILRLLAETVPAHRVVPRVRAENPRTSQPRTSRPSPIYILQPQRV